jgi:hypothetical protein
MTSILIKKQGEPENIFSCQGGLRGKMFENHCFTLFTQAEQIHRLRAKGG